MSPNNLLILAAIIATAIGFTSAKAQRVSENTSQYAVDAWQRRAQELRDNAATDIRGLGDGQKAFFLAELAELTWDFDRDAARLLLADASKSTIASLDIIDDEEVVRRLSGATNAITTIVRLDPELGQRTIEEFAKKAESVAGVNVRSGEAWTAVAVFLAAKYPKSAFAIGSKAILFGGGPEFYKLIGTLNESEPRLAENLLELTLASGIISTDELFASRLALLTRDGFRGTSFTDDAKRNLLSRYADILNRALNDRQRRPQLCRIAVPVVYLTDEYMRLLPERYTIVRAQTKICQAFAGSSAEDAERKFREFAPDDLIHQAELSPDTTVKSRLFSMAFEKLLVLKAFENGLAALDDMSDDEQRAFGKEKWRKRRIEFAALAAAELFRSGDVPALYRLINRTPVSIRAPTRLKVIREIVNSADDQLALEMCDKAFNELGNPVDYGPYERAAGFLALTRFYLKLRPTDSDASFRLAVKALNEIDSLNKNDALEKEYSPLESRLYVPSQLLENDESGLLSAIKSISKPRTRIRVELGLLQSVLTKYAEVVESSKPRGKYE